MYANGSKVFLEDQNFTFSFQKGIRINNILPHLHVIELWENVIIVLLRDSPSFQSNRNCYNLIWVHLDKFLTLIIKPIFLNYVMYLIRGQTKPTTKDTLTIFSTLANIKHLSVMSKDLLIKV